MIAEDTKILTVTQVNNHIKALMTSDSVLQNIYVGGELSNFKAHSSGHMYFSLKDESASIRCVMFDRDAKKLRFKPGDGLKVIAQGRVSCFPRDGSYQLYCSDISPEGLGSLYLAFEQLKQSLDKEGLFSKENKLPLPAYPRRIALITSPTGAVVQDMIRIIGRRWPPAHIIIIPVRVQGEEAPAEIRAAIRLFGSRRIADVAIVGRGGGSLEDLWAFNDEQVAREIFACPLPIVSAVGHEPDVTIADFVADARASTPSHAAELVTPDILDVKYLLDYNAERITAAMRSRISSLESRLNQQKERKALRDPSHYLTVKAQMLKLSTERLSSAGARAIYNRRVAFVKNASKLEAMSPLAILTRGYGVVANAKGETLRSVAQTAAGDAVTVRLFDGTLDCEVVNISVRQSDRENADAKTEIL